MWKSCWNCPVALFDHLSFSPLANTSRTAAAFENNSEDQHSFSNAQTKSRRPALIVRISSGENGANTRYRHSVAASGFNSDNARKICEPGVEFRTSAEEKGPWGPSSLALSTAALSEKSSLFSCSQKDRVRPVASIWGNICTSSSSG